MDEKAPVINWLKDEGMLPSAVTNARILAFNYHSNWAPGTDGTVIEMWQLGDELMREIVAERAVGGHNGDALYNSEADKTPRIKTKNTNSGRLSSSATVLAELSSSK